MLTERNDSMPKLNENYQNLKESYLFVEIAHRVAKYAEANPDKKIIRLGIGDVTRPLEPLAVEGLHEGVDAMTSTETFKGYGPEQGYDFLRQAVVDYYAENGVSIQADDVFISDGAKSDTGNIGDLFAKDNVVLIPDPVYPVYVDTNVMTGREILYIDANAENDFLPIPNPDIHADLIYICSPNNPTGNVFPAIEIERLITAFDGIVVVDEAYIDFSSRPSWIRRLNEFHNLVVLQTFSKAWGSAGVRLGMAFASPDIIGYYNQVKYPYNISALVQRYAMEMLDRENEVRRWVDEILSVRSRFVERLSGIPMVKTVYPSDANFVLVKMVDAEKVYLRLVTDGIVVRNRSKVALCGDCLRITIGTDREMNILLETLKSYS